MLVGESNIGGARLEHVTLLPPGHEWTALALAASGMHVSNAERLDRVLEGLGGEAGGGRRGRRERGEGEEAWVGEGVGQGQGQGQGQRQGLEGPQTGTVSVARQIQIAKVSCQPLVNIRMKQTVTVVA